MMGERGKQTLLSALLALLFLQGHADAQPTFSKKGPDPAPAAKPLALEEVFVTSKTPRKQNEAATVKEAYAKVKNGGVIFITEMSSDISNDDKALVIDRPVTIALDPGLLTEKAVESDDPLPRARLNAAADGACVIVGQYELGSPEGRREPRNEVTIRGIEFVPNPSSRPDTCVQLNDGRLFLDNVAIASAGQPFRTGVAVNGGELVTRENFFIDASMTGIAIRGGAVEIADGADILHVGPAPAEVSFAQTCDSLDGKAPVGIWAGDSADARVGDPLAILRGVDIDGFSVGLCAAGSGVSAESANIRRTSVGIRAEERMRLSASRVRDAKLAALIALSASSEFIGNKFFSSGVGVFLDSEKLPTFRENQFLFNGEGIRYGKPLRNEKSFFDIFFKKASETEKQLVASFTDNEVACNGRAGVFEKFRLFRKAHRNRCRYNTPGECSGARPRDLCDQLRGQLNVPPVCPPLPPL